MENTILYLDCDGVILNTIDEAMKIMQEKGLDINDPKVVNRFFINTDWNCLIERAGFINDSITKIHNLLKINMFKEIVILTKLSGNLEEESIKRTLFAKLLPKVRVVTVKLHDNKDEIVDPVNNILVEDSLSNAYRWKTAGGISIIFKQSNPVLENDEINDLEDVVTLVKKRKLSNI